MDTRMDNSCEIDPNCSQSRKSRKLILIHKLFPVFILIISSSSSIFVSADTIVINNEKIDTENLDSNRESKSIEHPQLQKRQDLSSLMVSGPDASDILQAAFAQAGVDLGGNVEPVSSVSDMFSSAPKRPSITERLRNIKLPSLPASITSAFNRRKVANGGNLPMASMLIPVLSNPSGHGGPFLGHQSFHRHLIQQSKPIKLFSGFKNPFKKEQHQHPHQLMTSASGSIPSFVLHPNNFHNPVNDQYITMDGLGQKMILPPPVMIHSSSSVSTSPSLPASSGLLNSNNQMSNNYGYPSYPSSPQSGEQGINTGQYSNVGGQSSGQQQHQQSSLTSDQNNSNNNNRPSNFISLTNNGNNNGYSNFPSSSFSSSLSPSSSSSSGIMTPKTSTGSSSYLVNLNYGNDNWTPTSALSVNGFKPILEKSTNEKSSSSHSLKDTTNYSNHNYSPSLISTTTPIPYTSFSPSISNTNYSSLINTETKRASHSLYETFAKIANSPPSDHISPSSSFGSSQSSSSFSPSVAYANSPAALSMPAQQSSRTFDPWKYNDSIPEESSNDILKYLHPNTHSSTSNIGTTNSFSLSGGKESISTETILSGLHKLFPINPSAILEQISRNEHLMKSKSSVDCVNKHLGWCDFTDNYPTPFVVAVIKECRDVIERMYVEVPQNLADFDDFVPFSPIQSTTSINKTTDTIDTNSKIPKVIQSPNVSKSRHIKAFSANSLSSKLSEWPSIANYRSGRSIDTLDTTANGQRSLCDSEKKFVRPSVAQDITGRWFVIVQSNLYHQQVPVDICRNPGSGCNNISECGSGARCVQKFNTQLLISIDLDKENDCPSMRLYRFPSGCVCDRPHYY